MVKNDDNKKLKKRKNTRTTTTQVRRNQPSIDQNPVIITTSIFDTCEIHDPKTLYHDQYFEEIP